MKTIRIQAHENNYNNLDAKIMQIFVSIQIFIEKYGVGKIRGVQIIRINSVYAAIVSI